MNNVTNRKLIEELNSGGGGGTAREIVKGEFNVSTINMATRAPSSSSTTTQEITVSQGNIQYVSDGFTVAVYGELAWNGSFINPGMGSILKLNFDLPAEFTNLLYTDKTRVLDPVFKPTLTLKGYNADYTTKAINYVDFEGFGYIEGNKLYANVVMSGTHNISRIDIAGIMMHV